MWNYRCFKVPFDLAKKLSSKTNKVCKFDLHDMSNRLSSQELCDRMHCLMVAIHVPKHVGNGLDPIAETVTGSLCDDSYLKLSKKDGILGRAAKSMLIPVVIKDYTNDYDVVQACVLAGGIPGLTTFWPRYFNNHWCCMDRMTSKQIKIKGSCANMMDLLDKDEHNLDIKEEIATASLINMNTIVMSPTPYDQKIFHDADIGICGDFHNPFPIFPFDLPKRIQSFISGYMDMQRRINNPKILDPKRSIKIPCEVNEWGNFVLREVDSPETIKDLINFILYESYAKDWQHEDIFRMNIDGVEINNYYTHQNVSLQYHEVLFIILTLILFCIIFFLFPYYFLGVSLTLIILIILWITSYLYGVDRINKEHKNS